MHKAPCPEDMIRRYVAGRGRFGTRPILWPRTGWEDGANHVTSKGWDPLNETHRKPT
jgi:hypothetical protein